MSTQKSEIRIIKTEEQYYAYLEQLDHLMSITPPLNSEDSDRLELLTLVLDNYERNALPIESPDPIQAIKFRMEEQGLKQADLVKYFGRASRVSEVLSGKRSLTIEMIRNVSEGLGISYEILIGTPTPSSKEKELSWAKFPIKEMMKRGWISNLLDRNSKEAKNAVKTFVECAISDKTEAAFRRTLTGDAVSITRQYAIYAWLACIIQKSRKERSNLQQFDRNSISKVFLKDLARLSVLDDGPKKAIQQLNDIGISVIFEPRIENTRLDGAALLDTDGSPVIGLTLRYDRVDSFWFTLLHEVVHVWKHLDSADTAIVDNLDVASEDRNEAEANRLAGDALVPRVKWKRSRAYLSPSYDHIISFAKEIGVHSSIVAGRLQHDRNNYSIFTDLAQEKITKPI